MLYERSTLYGGKNPGPTLLIVPTSLVGNWVRELERFSPKLTVHVNHGPDRPLNDEFFEIVKDRDIVITTYGLVSRDRETLCELQGFNRPVLGLDFVLTNLPYPFSAKASEESDLYFISNSDIEEALGVASHERLLRKEVVNKE